MANVIGQPISDLITILDSTDVPVLGLVDSDFATLEAFLISTPATTAVVTLDEVDEGQYFASFTPSTFGTWALHYVYSDLPTHIDQTLTYSVDSTAPIIVTMTGGTWTYGSDLTDPSQQVRFLIQDTDSSYPLFTDAEVSYALGKSNDIVRRAAAHLVERLMARYAAMADTTELDLSVRASQLYDHAKDLLRTLNSTFAANGSVVPYAGGISRSDMLVGTTNRDRFAGVFDKNNLAPWSKTP